ncbi:TonB-dependent receptor [Aurantiacibacter marinus]|uniref:TonB-dependent receptor n=1 Tax=Aurantiacibacter marinus TaxID=874156 RepID=A0A0H0XLR8_9SPHN|nr:TonB-dependent receptor [Aurantiacibacter marinus]KLI62882.1 TonB-dependent receptor [Aurantiacibacter marinus]
MKKSVLYGGAAAIALSLGMAPGIAFAQDASAQDPEGEAAAAQGEGIGRIVVTATRRDTDLQTTAVAVSAIDRSLIEQSNVGDIGGLATFVPNFSAETITGFNAASFAMRGVGQNNIIVYFEPPVAVLVDDFVIPSVQTQLLDTFDVEQVEVLRGPQGTLFGKNTTGGAVTVRTIRPEMNVFGLDARVQAGSFGTASAKAALNIPLVDDMLALRIVGGLDSTDGYYRNGACYGPITGFVANPFQDSEGCLNGDRIGNTEVWSARAKLLFEPTDNISALFQYEFLRDRSGSVPSVNENDRFTGTTPFLTDLLNTGSPNPASDDPLDNAGITLRDDALLFAGRGQRIDVDGLYANIDFDFDIGTLTSVTGWRSQRSRLPNSYPGDAPLDVNGNPLSIFDATRDDDRETFQQELRFSTDFEGPFNAIVGAFYQTDDTDFCVSQILGFLDLTGGPLPFGNWNDTPYILCNAQEAESTAIFGEGTFEITPELTLTGGLRYTWEDKTWRGRQQAFIAELEGGFDLGISIDEALDASVYNFPANVIQVEDSASELTWRASLGYQATPDLFFYSTVSHGFKAGGFNDQIGGFAAFGADLDAFAEAAQATRPETADSFELGVKSELFDNRLRFNLTGFYVEYNDLQRQLNVPIEVNGSPNQVTIFVNAASAEVAGIEAELTAEPTDGLTLRGILGYQDASYGEYDAPNAGYDLSTSPLDRAPEWQWTLDGNYNFELNNDFELTFNGNVAYQSSSLFTQAIDDPLGNTFLNSRTLLNASITLSRTDEAYYVRLIGQNLSDERYRTASQNVAGLWLNSQFGPPRFFGVEVGFSLGE